MTATIKTTDEREIHAELQTIGGYLQWVCKRYNHGIIVITYIEIEKLCPEESLYQEYPNESVNISYEK